MGKKIVSQVKAKISKKTSCNERKPLMNSLIKVLRPKVYIIESSGFKSLVQELTGNIDSTTVSSAPRIPEKSAPVIENGSPEASMSFDASVESFQVCDDLALSFDDTNSSPDSVFENSSAYGDDLRAFLELDDQQLFGCFNDLYSEIQQEVSIYDYELTGLV